MDSVAARVPNGYALWNYLTAPFLMSLPGFTVDEIDPVTDRGETWRGLRVHYPSNIASHSRVEFYFGSDHLVRRHDYRVDVASGFATMHHRRPCRIRRHQGAHQASRVPVRFGWADPA